ncbi:hypothetical protein MAPG_08419 [Magnaporthiopsis poae ATCC 64411]|uniref:Uncharacterized protein n=1 Tax=Magnaporthiopsis poae (strain ATCC 64411 / 73-15) TaxID=644358 RepID=A0A0C4E7B2_MAGP6|nr:hypothetical protein MAPG_08419 [Magnaporthiopsis poae ATCC 64411]
MGEYTGPVAVVSQSAYFVSAAPTTASPASNPVQATAAPIPASTTTKIITRVSKPSQASSTQSPTAPEPTPTWGTVVRVPTVHECRRDWGCCKGACIVGSWFTFGISCGIAFGYVPT